MAPGSSVRFISAAGLGQRPRLAAGTIKNISAFPRLDVGELGDEIKPLGLREPHGGALGVLT